MSKNKIPAKDLAFAKERLQLKQQINEQRQLVQKYRIENLELQDTIREKDDIIRSQKEWIERLLEYMDMSPEEFQKLRQTSDKQSSFFETMDTIFSRFFH